jgi:cytochrome c oxidase cbb3-type subunit 4
VTSGIITAVALLAFVAIVVWVFIVKRKEDFDEQANLPLRENDRQARENKDSDEEKSS